MVRIRKECGTCTKAGWRVHHLFPLPCQLAGPSSKPRQAVSQSRPPTWFHLVNGSSWFFGALISVVGRVARFNRVAGSQAINANSALQLRKAVALAPRGERAQWLLCIQVWDGWTVSAWTGVDRKHRWTGGGFLRDVWNGLNSDAKRIRWTILYYTFTNIAPFRIPTLYYTHSSRSVFRAHP